MELTTFNVSIVGKDFNPSLLTQGWLLENGIIDLSDLKKSFFAMPAMANVESSLLSFNIFNSNLTLIPQGPADGHQGVLTNGVGKIIEVMQGKPSYIDLHFAWTAPYVSTQQEDTRKLFFNPVSQFCKLFDVPDASFGAIVSKEYEKGVRLFLNIYHQFRQNAEIIKQFQFVFYYHKDLSGPDFKSEITEVLTLWNKAKAYSESLIVETLSPLK